MLVVLFRSFFFFCDYDLNNFMIRIKGFVWFDRIGGFNWFEQVIHLFKIVSLY
ncbi:hypothetical protein HanIR_Chr06g0298321 [Helianthus annuus]|nr:hypothetical protein HanIR_Chr06g0298321 [Helianthus annuus]